MEDGDTEKYHVSSLIQGFVFFSRKMGCIRCISSQVYNKLNDHTAHINAFYGRRFPIYYLTLLHSERATLYGVLAFVSAIGLKARERSADVST